ncbi:MAG: 2-amino-4-hydroxy-6-hydroxymethyldihydropteridine diphosphokinase [Bacteroidales bacterium]
MNEVLISLGSNTPDGLENIRHAIRLIETKALSSKFSSVYKSEPVGKFKHAFYHNCVGIITTDRDQSEWNDFFKNAELQMGRTAEMRESGNVPLDLDIIVWNDNIIRPADLIAPYLQSGLKQIGYPSQND